MLASIRDCQFLTILDSTGAFHGLKLSPDAAKKSVFITHLGKFQWNVAVWIGITSIILLKSDARHTQWFRRIH